MIRSKFEAKNITERGTFFLSYEKERWREKEGKRRIFWRNEMRVNVKLRSKKLRTKRNPHSLSFEMSKLSSWMKMEAVKMTSGSGSRFSMAQERPVHQPLWLFWWESIRYHSKWLVNYMSLNSRSILYIMMVTWNRTRESK